MSKAEEFIKEQSHIIENPTSVWISAYNARKAVEIAREEMVEKVIWWIEENIGEYCDGENIMFSAIDMENIDIFEQERFINDLKQAMKDE